ncbi:acetyl-CoA carboxylase biotin carboxyl carrier protein [Bacillus sp. EB106-08-02-XG196]|uniref:acetyl-CoA carboxylase biotin carboxyl carrier protein n=1 Tax=Bacillus sp. EB106-08-02-XG196 TaxID=2737049 RepID=UPI0015C4B4FE|nr:acetyl-CoA carboxylase biotin carboxyl carrier protein [Bacillus sp. EB106-08-02-XG196]NWQ43476.1 acetyl-CoA carboxylase biotin carboxyl carrier protein [Bacillus sp. EB106-08-02-XG196]
MFKIQEIREIIRLFDDSTVDCLELEKGDTRIFVRRNSMLNPSVIQGNESINLAIPAVLDAPVLVAATKSNEISEASFQAAATKEITEKEEKTPKSLGNENLLKIVSPMVGTFYMAPAIDVASYVKIGDKVEKSTVVCIVEAMKLFNEIEAEMDGEIVEVLVKNGQLVEYGQPLFLVKQTS